jgi:hypothetical protein
MKTRIYFIEADNSKDAQDKFIRANDVPFGEFYTVKVKCISRPTKNRQGMYKVFHKWW